MRDDNMQAKETRANKQTKPNIVNCVKLRRCGTDGAKDAFLYLAADDATDATTNAFMRRHECFKMALSMALQMALTMLL